MWRTVSLFLLLVSIGTAQAVAVTDLRCGKTSIYLDHRENKAFLSKTGRKVMVTWRGDKAYYRGRLCREDRPKTKD